MSIVNRGSIIKGNMGDTLYIRLASSLVVIFGLFCLFPFWLIVINSFSDSSILNTEGFKVLPLKYSLNAYKSLMEGVQIYRSYGITIVNTVVGTTLGTLIASTYAYGLSHRKVKYGNTMAFLTYFTMIMGSGLVGFYILVVMWLQLKNNIFAMILPYILNPFYVFVLMSFFRTLPYEVYESASVDGANDIYIFFRIILPVSKPVLATIVLFYILQYWNDWWLALLFIDIPELHPLQLMLRKLIELSNISSYITGGNQYVASLPSEGIKLSTTVLSIGPIIFVYPFLQKYFIKGITMGAVKG